VIPELPELNSGFASCYPKFPNKIRVSGISGSGSGIPGSGFGLRVFCPALHNTTTSRSTGFTPFKLLFGDEAITPEEAKTGSIRI
jgi:hypothetical protein